MTAEPTFVLVEIAGRMESAFRGGMQSQLQWMEDAALALDAADLGDDGAAASRDLKAALGAVLAWAKGPQDPKTVDELEGLMRTLLTRACVHLYRALAESLRGLADVRTAQRSTCLDLAGVFTSLARSMERGEPPPVDALERFAKLAGI